jgi:hypothetical protein
MNKIIDRLFDQHSEFIAPWDREFNSKMDEMAKCAATKLQEKLDSLRVKYNMTPLEAAGFFIFPDTSYSIYTTGVELNISYEFFRRNKEERLDKSQVYDRLIKVSYTNTGNAINIHKDMSPDEYTDIITLNKNTMILLQWMQASNLYQLARDVVQAEFDAYNDPQYLKLSDEASELRDRQEAMKTKIIDSVYASITPGDDLTGIVGSKHYYDKYRTRTYLPSTPIFDKITKQDSFRVIHKFTNTDAPDRKESFSVDTIKQTLRNRLNSKQFESKD